MSAATEHERPELGSLERPLTREGRCYVRGCDSPAEHLRTTATGVFVSYCTEGRDVAERYFGRGGRMSEPHTTTGRRP